jgi:hypothetical protein
MVAELPLKRLFLLNGIIFEDVFEKERYENGCLDPYPGLYNSRNDLGSES